MTKTILIVGTYDTKDDELRFIEEVITTQGGAVLTMDVSILKDPQQATDISKHDVAQAGDSTIPDIIALGDENAAMQAMAVGASRLTTQYYHDGKIHGILVLGGSMGTDLALDVCQALPLGVPKYIVSTVAFSPLIPAERLAADTQMILWAGGLYGLNSVCKASLSQAAGAVLGAANAVQAPDMSKPLIGMTSLGKTALSYMVTLKPALEERGFEVAVFHATGMGGRAFESLAAQSVFACVFDFCTQELGNDWHESSISAGPGRLTAAGLNGTPQLVAPGCYDLVDIVGWQPVPDKWAEHPKHAHNRLITSIVLNNHERTQVAQTHGTQLAKATGPVAVLLPQDGLGEWDREGADLHDADGLRAFLDALEATVPDTAEVHKVDGHINDAIFAETALRIFDDWRAKGIVKD